MTMMLNYLAKTLSRVYSSSLLKAVHTIHFWLAGNCNEINSTFSYIIFLALSRLTRQALLSS